MIMLQSESMFAGLRDIGAAHKDSQERQLESLLLILQSSGQILSKGWPYVFDICVSAAVCGVDVAMWCFAM
jgi:hypothetical protein